MNPKFITHLSGVIAGATCHPFVVRNVDAVGGGSINAAYRLRGVDGGCYFVKLNAAQHHAMFAAEATALDAIAATNTLRVPRPIVQGVSGKHSYLVLEYLQLNSRGNAQLLGEQLAALHRWTAPKFGFPADNFIGTTPQPNKWQAGWIDFWREQRLGFQLQLAAQNGCTAQLRHLGGRLLDALPEFFAGYTPQPSLLHGDLWSGNHAFLGDGTPTIFDPASYYGDRECDVAMTELFGGYPENFYTAYRAAFPLDAGYPTRRDLYNLYHILNHANLFGGGYVGQAEQMVRGLLAAC
ncbi:MAG: fructosamine kinase family protein [Pseudomonadota bacterium]